jgi:hypothetical protein
MGVHRKPISNEKSKISKLADFDKGVLLPAGNLTCSAEVFPLPPTLLPSSGSR